VCKVRVTMIERYESAIPGDDPDSGNVKSKDWDIVRSSFLSF